VRRPPPAAAGCCVDRAGDGLSAAANPLAGRTVVVLGATGYLGRLVLPALGAAGAHVRAAVRRPDELGGVPHAERARVAAGDPTALARAVRGADVVLDLWPAALEAASAVDVAARAARIVRVRCLLHGAEPIERPGVADVRASLVIGAGSPGFDLLRRLADRLPVIPLPRYAERRLQPVASGDLVPALVALCAEPPDGASIALTGPDTLRVREMLSQVGALLGKRPSRIAMPFDAPGAASLVRRLVGTDAQTMQAALEALDRDVLVEQGDVERLIGRPPTPFALAIRAALAAGRRLR
jgi:uncharacterized protein YbjT (DUF2867 family)